MEMIYLAGKQEKIFFIIVFGYSVKVVYVGVAYTLVPRNNVVNICVFFVSLKWAYISVIVRVKGLAFRNAYPKAVVIPPTRRRAFVKLSKGGKYFFKPTVNRKIL